MTDIQNIIFDFGGVIYDIDFERSMLAFQKLGLDKFDELYSQAIQDQLFEKLECNQISGDEFKEQLKSYFDETVSNEQIDYAWNTLLVGYKKERLNLLFELRENYEIYLLSNTNIIHYDVFIKEFSEITGMKSFNELFNKAYLSFEMGCRKPDSIIYEKLITDSGIVPEKSLFIDDSFQNLKPAQNLGIHTYFLDLKKGEDVLNLFEDGILKAGLRFNPA